MCVFVFFAHRTAHISGTFLCALRSTSSSAALKCCRAEDIRDSVVQSRHEIVCVASSAGCNGTPHALLHLTLPRSANRHLSVVTLLTRCSQLLVNQFSITLIIKTDLCTFFTQTSVISLALLPERHTPQWARRPETLLAVMIRYVELLLSPALPPYNQFCKYSQLHMSVKHEHEHGHDDTTIHHDSNHHNKGLALCHPGLCGAPVMVLARTPTVHWGRYDGRPWVARQTSTMRQDQDNDEIKVTVTRLGNQHGSGAGSRNRRSMEKSQNSSRMTRLCRTTTSRTRSHSSRTRTTRRQHNRSGEVLNHREDRIERRNLSPLRKINKGDQAHQVS